MDISRDKRRIEEFFSIVSNSTVRMLPVIELEVLALVTCWNMKGFTITCMSVQVMGTILNRCVGSRDNNWGQRWEYVGRSMKVYALSNLRSTTAALVVLMGIAIRDFSPDPDILCKQRRLFQSDSCYWFCELVMMSIHSKEIDRAVIEVAGFRKDLILRAEVSWRIK